MIRSWYFNSYGNPGDRLYTASDLKEMANGLVNNGVYYPGFGHHGGANNHFTLTTGFGFFNGIWVLSSSEIEITVPSRTSQYTAYLVVEIDLTNRTADIKVVTTINNTNHFILYSFTVPRNSTYVPHNASNYTDMRGTTSHVRAAKWATFAAKQTADPQTVLTVAKDNAATIVNTAAVTLATASNLKGDPKLTVSWANNLRNWTYIDIFYVDYDSDWPNYNCVRLYQPDSKWFWMQTCGVDEDPTSTGIGIRMGIGRVNSDGLSVSILQTAIYSGSGLTPTNYQTGDNNTNHCLKLYKIIGYRTS